MADPMTDPATIAAGLTAAQKRALLRWPESGMGVRIGKFARGEQAALMTCMARGLAETTYQYACRGWRLTPLGLSVRRHLAAQREGGGDV